ncbi:MAG: glycosyltransferase family 2 protein [Betaproteobacteria bacterium]|nr:glycosyltransferase family 2 protein [Betaproteobacteria bacterium]
MFLLVHARGGIFDTLGKRTGKFGNGILDAVRRVLGRFVPKSTPEPLSPAKEVPTKEAVRRSRKGGSVAKNKIVAVIPVYNHGETVGDVVATLRGYGLPVIMVDDGSDTFTARTMDEIVSTRSAFGPPVKLVRLPKNRGKGAAVMVGFRSAYGYGATHVLQVDADGQHGLEIVPRFLAASTQAPDAVIAGFPHYDATVPRMRLFGSYLTIALVWINTLSRRIAGPMCGFRLYPLAAIKDVLPTMAYARRMNFDTEIAVRLDWENVPFVNLPVAIRYPLGGFSHFRIVRDSLHIMGTHVRLFFGMIRRFPDLFSRHPELQSRVSRLLSYRFRLGGALSGKAQDHGRDDAGKP